MLRYHCPTPSPIPWRTRRSSVLRRFVKPEVQLATIFSDMCCAWDSRIAVDFGRIAPRHQFASWGDRSDWFPPLRVACLRNGLFAFRQSVFRSLTEIAFGAP